MPRPKDEVLAEVEQWFFVDYFAKWVAQGAGHGDDAQFVLQYWGAPLHFNGLGIDMWFLDEAGVLTFLEMNQAPLRESGYTHTVVPDRRITVYSDTGAGIDVIWSRRRADESEILRVGVHFEVARTTEGQWRVISLQAAETTENTLDAIWHTRQLPPM